MTLIDYHSLVWLILQVYLPILYLVFRNYSGDINIFSEC